MSDFHIARARIGGLKGVMRKLGDAPEHDHKWKTMPKCPFCGNADCAGVFNKGGTDFFKCHHTDCSSGGAVVTELGYIALRLGLSETNPVGGGASPAYQKFLEMAGMWELPSSDSGSPREPKPKVELPNPVLPPSAVPETGVSKAPLPPSPPPPPKATPPATPNPAPAPSDLLTGLAVLREFYNQLQPTHEQLTPEGNGFKRESLLEKRGLTPTTCERLGFRANPQEGNEKILLALRDEFKWEDLRASGLWLEADRKRKLDRRMNTQFCGKGQVGRKPEKDRRNKDDKWLWGWCEPVLIPYFNEGGELIKLRPHKGGATAGTIAGSERIYVPRDYRHCSETVEKFSTVVICEGEYKAAAIWQMIGAGRRDGREPVGVCAIPGISFARNIEMRADLETWLEAVGCRRVIVAFDDEDKSDKPMRLRHDAQKYARYLAIDLGKKLHLMGLVAMLPKEWRNANGKADWDGALAMLLKGNPSSEALERARAAFEAVLDAAVSPNQMGLQEFVTDEEEQFIQREVERLLYEPTLPNAGPRERKWLEKLKVYAKDETLVIIVKAAAGRYAQALEGLLPRQEFIKKGEGWLTLPGCYYTHRPVTPKTNKNLYDAAHSLLDAAKQVKDYGKKWLAEFLLAGAPEAVSNFKMECLYLLRDATGNVTRLVRMVNTLGEISEGREIGEADVLPSLEFSSAEKFRAWCLGKGNFNWGVGGGAGNIELQMLHADVSHAAAYRVVRLIEYCGWHALDKPQDKPQTKTEEVDADRVEKRSGIWFNDECAYMDGERILPDEDGIFWHQGMGYAFARKGRETEFTHGRPRMRPDVDIKNLKFDKTDWESPAEKPPTITGEFFREVCRRFFDTAGGYEGWLAVGAVLGYAAAPEIFQQRKMFPGLWVSGQMGSGKTTFVSWLMSIAGFSVESGLGLISKNVTAVGIMCQLENYSNLPVWLDEFRQAVITPDKEAILRDVYNRQLAAKWSPDGFQRTIRTATLVSGESTTSDAAMRSRYPHVLISEQRRKANHYEWMQRHQEWFFLFWRTVMERRAEFVEAVMTQMDYWMAHGELEEVSSRDRVTHAVAYAAFAAATVIFDSHSAAEVTEFRKFVAEHARRAAADVATDVNVNVFMQEVITAYQQGAITDDCFRVETAFLEHPPGEPTQGRWTSCILFMNPARVIDALQIHLRKGGSSVTLRYKDLRDQLSKNDFWVNPGEGKYLQRRIGGSNCRAWGIIADKHPLGYQRKSDEEFRASLRENTKLEDVGITFKDGDPRKGPLYAIIDGVLKWEKSKEQP
jgi:hypothetical protein